MSKPIRLTLTTMVVKEKKERLSLDVIGQLEDAVENDPLDYKSWTKLIDQVIAKDKEEQVRSVFERYLAIFKYDARQWSNYINFELNRADFARVVDLFAKCLLITTDVDLCRTYVLYVRRVNDVITGGEKARSTVVLAFDFAVKKCGVDVDSTDLWNDYLDFFKTWTPSTSWEQQQKIDLIRRLYRRCLVIPTMRIESMWSDYTKWENEVSTANTASKNIADLSTAYMEARLWSTEWRHVTKNAVRRRMVPVLAAEDPNDIVAGQVEAWHLWLAFERKNTLHLDDEELRHRIDYVYRRAVAVLPFVPEMWFRYSNILLDEDRTVCAELLADGLRLNPSSFLLTFQAAEVHERDGAFAKAQSVYETTIKTFVAKHAAVQLQVDAINSRSAKRTNKDDRDLDLDLEEPVQYTEAEALQMLTLEGQLHQTSQAVTSLYIQLMAMCKRSQGIREVRNVFKQRKSFKALGYQFYVENALMELYTDNKKIADKVFDLAMKQFEKDGGFLVAYLDYLIVTNSVEALKIFFEIAVNNLAKESAAARETLLLATVNILHQKRCSETLRKNDVYMRQIIRRYITFASKYLDLDTVVALQKRYVLYFPDDDALALFIDRYKSGDFNGVAKYDLGTLDVQLVEEEEEEDEEKPRKRRKVDNYSPEVDDKKENGMQVSPQLHGFVGNTIYGLLQVLPNAGYFGPPAEHVFNSTKLVELFGNLPLLPGET